MTVATFQEFDGELDAEPAGPKSFQEFDGELDTPAAEPAVPKKSKFERAQDDFVNGLKKLPKDAAALADMALSLPGQMVGIGADMGMRAVALGYGIDNRTAGIMAQKFRHDIADPLSNPIEKLMHAFGYDKGYTDANVAQAMNKVGSWMEKGGEYVERQTGGQLTKEDVDSLGNAALGALGARGTSAALQARLDKLGKADQATLKPIPEEPKVEPAAPKPSVTAQAIDEALGIKPAVERAAENKTRRAEIRKTFADDPDLADYHAFKADERARQAELERPKPDALEENFPTTKGVKPDLPPDVMIADALGNVAKTADELAILRDPGTQAAIKKFVETRPDVAANQRAVMKGQRGGVDTTAVEDLAVMLRNLGIENAEGMAKAALANVDETRRAVPASQRGAVNMEVFTKEFKREKELPNGIKLLMEGGEEGPMIRAWKEGKEVGRLGLTADEWFNPKPESNLQAAWVDAIGAKGQGLPEAMYKFAAEQGDIVKSKAQTVAGKKMWEKFEAQGLAKDGTIPKGQRGQLDAGDAKRLAAVATGAVVGSQVTDDPLFGGIVGAAFTAGGGYALRKGTKPALEATMKGADYVGGLVSTRIGNISQPILHRARAYEQGVLTRTHELLDRAHPFIEALSKVKGEKADTLARAILTNDPIKVKAAFDAVGDTKLSAEWSNVRGMLDELGTELKDHGRVSNLRENYFPRVVKDLDGLMSALGTEVRTRLQKDLAEAQAKSLRATGSGLSDLDQTAIINRALTTMGDGMKGKPGFSKARQIDTITKELQPFYAPPVESLHSYLSMAAKDLERSKFFGRDLAKVDGKVDLQASIGNVVKRELDAGNITFPQAEELGSMLRSRFGPGEASSAALIQDVKNMINAGLLGNVVSAATQLGDIGTTAAIQGLRPTVESVIRQLTGNNRVNMKDFGLADHISEEFVSTRKSAKFLNTTFKLGLFSAVDRFGKNVGLNAALSKLEGQAKTVGGMKALERKYGEAFGEDFPALVQELKSGKPGENVQAALFSELSDMQPITRLEVPQAYLDMPNGRAAYMLKTFMLKQFDIVRRDGYNEIKRGNVAAGVKNLTKYAVALGISGATTDTIRKWLMGQEVDFDTDDLAKNVLKTFGWSEYVLDQAKKGTPVKAVGGTLLPPYKMFDDLYKASGGGTMSEASREKARNQAAQYIPVFGKLFESHLLGGAERRDALEAKRKEKTQ